MSKEIVASLEDQIIYSDPGSHEKIGFIEEDQISKKLEDIRKDDDIMHIILNCACSRCNNFGKLLYNDLVKKGNNPKDKDSDFCKNILGCKTSGVNGIKTFFNENGEIFIKNIDFETGKELKEFLMENDQIKQ